MTVTTHVASLRLAALALFAVVGSWQSAGSVVNEEATPILRWDLASGGTLAPPVRVGIESLVQQSIHDRDLRCDPGRSAAGLTQFGCEIHGVGFLDKLTHCRLLVSLAVMAAAAEIDKIPGSAAAKGLVEQEVDFSFIYTKGNEACAHRLAPWRI